MRYYRFLFLTAVLVIASCSSNQSNWTGTWQAADSRDHGGDLHCIAQRIDEQAWMAKFSGYCGRQFVYSIDMKGHQQGEIVAFEGEVDLGEKDGGVYHWKGEMSEDQFVGQYTTAGGGEGTFKMGRQ